MKKEFILIVFIISIIIPQTGSSAETSHKEGSGIAVPDVR
jgi:hypothetical protein